MTGQEFLNFLVGTSSQLGMTDANYDDTEYRAFLLQCLNLTLKDISNRQQNWHWRWLEKTATASTVANQIDYDLPTDIDTNKVFSVFDRTNDRTYRFIPYDRFVRLVPDPSTSTGDPGWYTMWAETLKLYPIPSSAFNIFLSYIKNITELADDENTTDVPKKYDKVIIDGALTWAYKLDKEMGDWAKQTQVYEQGIELMKRDNMMNINELTETESHRGNSHSGVHPFRVDQ